jgi:hypothetical protein
VDLILRDGMSLAHCLLSLPAETWAPCHHPDPVCRCGRSTGALTQLRVSIRSFTVIR